MKKTAEIEIQRTNISARQFYTYCKKRLAEKVGIDIECWAEYEDWANPRETFSITSNHEDWDEPKREIVKIQPYEMQEYLQGVYNFIMEWNEGVGYLYHAELG